MKSDVRKTGKKDKNNQDKGLNKILLEAPNVKHEVSDSSDSSESSILDSPPANSKTPNISKVEPMFTEESDSISTDGRNNISLNHGTDEDIARLAGMADDKSSVPRLVLSDPTDQSRPTPLTDNNTSLTDSPRAGVRKRKHKDKDGQGNASPKIKHKKRDKTRERDSAVTNDQQNISSSQPAGIDDSVDNVQPSSSKISQEKIISYDTPDKHFLSDYVSGQLWAKDLQDSELWLVKMPIGFDVKSLSNTNPIPGASVEVCRKSSKTQGSTVIEMETSRTNTLQESSYTVLLPSQQKRNPVPVGKFVGEIQITKHVVTKPYTIETPVKKKRELPEGLKLRHVPFGADGPIPVLNSSGMVLEALQRDGKIDAGEIPVKMETGDAYMLSGKKKKKKNKHKKLQESVDSSTLSIDVQDSSVVGNNISQQSFNFDDTPAKSKKKRKKHKLDDLGVDSFVIKNEPSPIVKIENTSDLIDSQMDNSIRIKEENLDSIVIKSEIDDLNQSSTKKKKKKKKSKFGECD